jgi:predicted nucleic acid-binding Zn ribbon protein
MQRLGPAIEDLLGKLGISGKIKEYDAVERWPEVVGQQVAKVTQAQAIKSGILIVRVSNGPWRNELQLLKAEIIRKLNEDLGQELVKDIRFI